MLLFWRLETALHDSQSHRKTPYWSYTATYTAYAYKWGYIEFPTPGHVLIWTSTVRLYDRKGGQNIISWL